MQRTLQDRCQSESRITPLSPAAREADSQVDRKLDTDYLRFEIAQALLSLVPQLLHVLVEDPRIALQVEL